MTRDGPTVTGSPCQWPDSETVGTGTGSVAVSEAHGRFKLPTESGAAGPGRTLELPLSADWINLNLKIAVVVLHRRRSGVCNGRFHRLECAPLLRPTAIGISLLSR